MKVLKASDNDLRANIYEQSSRILFCTERYLGKGKRTNSKHSSSLTAEAASSTTLFSPHRRSKAMHGKASKQVGAHVKTPVARKLPHSDNCTKLTCTESQAASPSHSPAPTGKRAGTGRHSSRKLIPDVSENG